MNVNEKINFLKNKSNQIYFIHYSCENLNDANEGYSPRITSIAVLHMESSQMSSFSMHLIAEEMHVCRDKISEKYNEIEAEMLKRFYMYVQCKGEDAIWLHWNMMNVNFGFETLEHRFRVLTDKEPYHIDEKNRFNISSLISQKYGSNYTKDPKMINLMELNGGKHRDFLTGAEEVTAFKANEFVKMHNSTMCKVKFFESVLRKMVKNKLRTNTNQFRYKVNELYQNPIVQIIGIIGIAGSIVSLILMLIKGGA